jgi:hypothetical protein
MKRSVGNMWGVCYVNGKIGDKNVGRVLGVVSLFPLFLMSLLFADIFSFQANHLQSFPSSTVIDW